MEDNLCKCHCGTRITIDEQLLEERQTWRQKYRCLQKQATNDIGRLKQNIYAECAALMQQEFTAKEAQTNQIVNQKNVEIKSLTSRVINLEARIKILEKENQILKSKEKEMEVDVADKERLLQNVRSRGTKSQRDWQVKLEEEVTLVRKRITQQYQDNLQALEAENDHLKHKVREYEKKYQVIIPEVQKLKNSLNSKNQQLELLETKLEKTKKDADQQIQRAKQQLEEIEKNHSKCKNLIAKLNDKVQGLTQDLEASRKVKREVKVEPVYIQRPVEVEKIVEKIVEVEKVVNKYIEPTSFRDEQLEGQNSKLKEQLTSLVKQIQLFEDRHRFTVAEYEQCIKQHEDNAVKYKKEREALAKTIEEQQKEIDMIHVYLQRRKVDSRNSQPQKIIVHVNKDGTYQKTVENIAGSNANTNSIPVNARVNRKR